MTITLFIPCFVDALFPRAGISMVEILERLGHTVTFPIEQTCCGQMHYNTGYHGEAVPLVRRFVQMFRDAEAVCVPSASCVAMMREHYELMAERENDPADFATCPYGHPTRQFDMPAGRITGHRGDWILAYVCDTCGDTGAAAGHPNDTPIIEVPHMKRLNELRMTAPWSSAHITH